MEAAAATGIIECEEDGLLPGQACVPCRPSGPAGRPASAGRQRAGPAALTWLNLGWVGVAGLAAWVAVVLAAWWWFWPSSLTGWVTGPARRKWRTWFYRRRWAGVMTIADLAPWYQGRTLLRVLGKVTATRYTDRVQVRLVSGQSAADFAKRAENLAHGFGAPLCRVRTAKSGAVLLEFVRRDAWPPSSPPFPSRPAPTSKRSRSGGARTAWRGWSSCTARMC